MNTTPVPTSELTILPFGALEIALINSVITPDGVIVGGELSHISLSEDIARLIS